MSLRLIKPGMPGAARIYPSWHSRAGEEVEPIGTLPSGKAVWPVLGGASDDPNDPAFTGEEGDDCRHARPPDCCLREAIPRKPVSSRNSPRLQQAGQGCRAV